MTDCLLIGFNDMDFSEYVHMVQSMGTESGAFRDVNLAFVNYENRPMRSMDLINRFYFEDKPENSRQFSNVDFVWPVITYLGTYLHKRGFSFDYVNLFHLQKEELADKLEHGSIRTVAITTTLYVSPLPILEIISFVRKHNESAKIIVGGPFIVSQARAQDATSLQQLFKYLGADLYVINQEGEATLVNILKALRNGGDFANINNLAYKQGEDYVITPALTESNSLEENMVDYRLFPQQEFGQFVTLRTAKSCPFSCAFCAFPQHSGKYTYLSVDLVEKELNAIRDIGSVTTLTFIDDTFNVPKGRFKELLRMMIANGYGFKWNSFYRSDHGDPETIELMGKAGCEGVFLGIESGSDKMLERMNKSARKKDYLRAIPLLRDAGISAHANFIVGFPGDTYETVQETIDLVETAKPDFFRAQLWYCDPITPIWQKRELYGVRGLAFNWTHNSMDCSTGCAIIDRIFLAVRNSVWMPQNGFEQWSVFYLQRKGMDMARIKLFLNSFNAAIKEKLLYPEKKEVSPELIHAMRQAARFDEPSPGKIESVEVLSADAFVKAERFWVSEFAQEMRPTLDRIQELLKPAAEGETSVSWLPDTALVEQLVDECEGDLPSVCLALYVLLLARISAGENVSLIATQAAKERGTTPLFITQVWKRSFHQLVTQMQEKFAEGKNKAFFGFALLNRPHRLAVRGLKRPTLDAAFTYSEGHCENHTRDIDQVLESCPELASDLQMVLELNLPATELHAKLTHRRKLQSTEPLEQLISEFSSLAHNVAGQVDTPLREVLTSIPDGPAGEELNSDVSEAMDFSFGH